MRILNPRPRNGNRPPPPYSIAYTVVFNMKPCFFVKRRTYCYWTSVSRLQLSIAQLRSWFLLTALRILGGWNSMLEVQYSVGSNLGSVSPNESPEGLYSSRLPRLPNFKLEYRQISFVTSLAYGC